MGHSKIQLSNQQKILIVMFELSKGKKKMIPFVNIVVRAFKKYKNSFNLPGFKEYPDSELVNRELYRGFLKQNGLIIYGNKAFSLTDKGIDSVRQINKEVKGKSVLGKSRMQPYISKELNRITKLDSFTNFTNGNTEKILDTDFYNYLGVTVRTEKKDFIARLQILKDTLLILQKEQVSEAESITKFNKFMMGKFKNDLEYILNT